MTYTPEPFHAETYDSYQAMLSGLAYAISDSIYKEPTVEAPGVWVILTWIEETDDGGFSVRASKVGGVPDEEFEDVAEALDPDFWMTSYDDERPDTVHHDLVQLLDERYGDQD
ncbi:hypothetical protein [Paenirhodobacter populi]|uniref:Uncharacterized protein n=1 Tax=Paenirhodobacter populi TaxID=2306993 RepID=A0A443J026_9RHOB|nr:hypothetical protein [Sinirhodobacter populi]RWR13804.1 hypothetical protein D2T33_05240 [Sinirhodobacter populi]